MSQDFRDVTPKADPMDDIKVLINLIIQFFKNPREEITRLPNLSWKKLLFIQVVFSLGAGFISGFIPNINPYVIIGGIFLLPLTSLITVFVLTSLFYYYFQVFENRTVDFRQLFTLCVFANLPFFLFRSLHELLSVFTIIGFLSTAFLMMIGLTEVFKLDKKKSIKLVSILFSIVFITWLWNLITARYL